jgi:hypothetical protein
MSKNQDLTDERNAQINQDRFDELVVFIHSAIESEQDEPADFNDETELRLNLVYRELREILGITEP